MRSLSFLFNPYRLAVGLLLFLAAGSVSLRGNHGYHTAFIKSDGSLWGMGENDNGELGDGTTTQRSSPVEIVSSGVVAVATGGNHTTFIKSDGSLWATGYNNYGQLGDGTTTQRTTPVQVVPSGVVSVSVGYYHTAFIKSDGSLWVMGYNNYGELGLGDTTQRNTPVQVVSSGVVSVSAGTHFTTFIKSDGSLWGMGYNAHGELGDGTTTQRNTPIEIISSGVVSVSAGHYVTRFFKSDGSLWAIGYNTHGELGDGTTTHRHTPLQMVSSGVASAARGYHHSVFLKSDGSLWATGYNHYGQLGDGTTTERYTPLQVVSSGVVSVSAGFYHTTFLKSDGSLWATGNNSHGQLGLGDTSNRSTPVQIVSSGVASLSGASFLGSIPVFTSLDGNTTSAVSHPENVLPVVTLTATDDDNQSLTYSISGGTDSALFEINATTNALQFIAHPDYEYPHDSNGDNAYDVTVIVSDGNLTDAQDVTVNVTDANDTYWTFTNAGVTGRTGPTQSQVNAAYVGTTLEGNVTINTQGIQEWTVPEPGVYMIETRGAKGGSSSAFSLVGGQGARMKGEFQLNANQVLKILVGQQGGDVSQYKGSGGGGGTFVVKSNNTPLIIAGGGGGGGGNSNAANGQPGLTGTSGGAGSSANQFPGGTNGSGGSADSGAGGGGGFSGNGTISTYSSNNLQSTHGLSFVNGGVGGQTDSTGNNLGAVGGFGGGAGGEWSHQGCSGAGGGYSGGGGTNSSGVAGGGGSYNDGSNQYNVGGSNSGHGLVVITFIEPSNLAPTDLSLSNSSVAENSSVGATVGSFSATDPDENGTSVYSYSLVDGNGSTDNASFTLEANGTLKTAEVFDYETKASYAVRVSVADEYNATYEEAFTISVTDVDDTAPVITLLGNATVTHEAAGAYSDAGATWTDAVDGNGTAVLSGSVNVSVPGVYTLTYSKSDVAGNAATQITRTVTVQDTTIPVITLSGSSTVTHEAATAYSDAGANWTDTLDGIDSAPANGSVNVNVPGVYTLTYDLNDTAGNSAARVTRTVTVQDTTVPVITLSGLSSVTHEAVTAYSDAGATWADTLDGNGSVSANGSVNVSVPGVYILTYSKSDAAGNAATQISRTVTVQDTTIPVITLSGSSAVTHEAATAYSDAGATWTDTLDGNGSVSANGSVNVSVPGVYTLTYSKSDAAGNAAVQVTRTVTVQDTTPPVITLNGESNASHEAGAPYLELGAVWTDALDGNGSASVSGSVDANHTGVYLLNYSHTDVAGNSAEEVTRSVTVFNLSPLGVELSGLSLEEGLSSATAIGAFSVPVNPDSNVSKRHSFALVEGSGSEGNANFSIDEAGRLLSGVSFDYESQVSFSIRVRATDQFGGEAEETFTISVVDAFEPIVDTQPADGVDAGVPTLRGVVADLGHSGGILGHGFLLGTTPDLKLGNPDVSNLSATSDGTFFSVAATELIAGKTYYYKAYATNVEGTGYGAQERFTAAEQASGPSWAGAVASPDAADWWTSPWFGSFFLSSNGWLRHEKLGWLFAIDEGAGGVWLWQENLGWLWTGEGIYPYLFLNAENGWGFLLGDTENRLFIYRFSDSTWLDVAEGAEQQ